MTDTYDDLFKKYKVITEGIDEPDPCGDAPTLIDESLTLYYQKFMTPHPNKTPVEVKDAIIQKLEEVLKKAILSKMGYRCVKKKES
jgi:hypothetical protein